MLISDYLYQMKGVLLFCLNHVELRFLDLSAASWSDLSVFTEEKHIMHPGSNRLWRVLLRKT